jgi:NAD(P)-dependent dehydrogenase (short-subunit alcohol dehydrogenase family)
MSDFPFSLEGMSVLVTGASSGVGRATAIMASQMGAHLIITGRNEERLKETLGSLEGPGHRTLFEDLAAAGASERLAEQLPEIDGMVYAAGVAEIIPYRMINDAHIERVMKLNFQVPVQLTQNLIRRKKLLAGGSLVYVTAIADHAAPVGSAVYSASKAALATAIKSLALEVAKTKIRANCLAPGYVRTPMFEKLGESSSVDEYLKLAPLGLIEPEEVASSAVYLLSPASRWVTRTSLVIDSGLTLRMR